MTILKNWLSRISAIWVLYQYVGKVNVILKNYPGVENEIRLRAWLLDNLAVLSGMAANTTNPVDDMLVLYTLRIIQNDTAWKILYGFINTANNVRENLLLPHRDSDKESLIFENVEQSQTDVICSLYEMDTAIQVEDFSQEISKIESQTQNPLMLISAVGLIFQIIQFLRNRK